MSSYTVNEKKKNEIIYYPYFEEGRMPPSRQCIYQVTYCYEKIYKYFEE